MKPPIADPIEAGMPEDEEQPFYLAFPSLLWNYFWIYCLVLGPILWSILFPTFYRPHGRKLVQPEGVLVLVLVLCFFAALLAAVMIFWVPVRVSNDGLKGTNWLGFSREVAWGEIRKVSFRWSVLPYALISTPQKRNVIWLPLILKDLEGFARSVEKYTTPDHPLRLFLAERGY